MTPLETIRGLLDHSITYGSEFWPYWMSFRPMGMDLVIECGFRARIDSVCEAILAVLDDPETEIVKIRAPGSFPASRFTTRLFKHPKVYVKFTSWMDFLYTMKGSGRYIEWIVLIPTERVILPAESAEIERRRLLAYYHIDYDLKPVEVNVLAYLVPWTLPPDHPDYHTITKMIEEARQKKGLGLDKIVKSHPYLFGSSMTAFKHLPDHLTRFVVTVNTRPDLVVGDSGPR